MNRRTFYLRSLGFWFVLLVAAFVLGALREAVLRPLMGEFVARIVGTLIAVAVMISLICWFVGWTQPNWTRRDLLAVGVLWLTLTVAFEFVFFHFVMGVPWQELLADYDIREGRLWILVLLTVLLGPALCSVRLGGK